MTVVVKYVVERNGEEKMTFTSKAEADAYDKMLDMADAMFELLAKSSLVSDEVKQEAISLYLVENKDEVLYALGAKKRPTAESIIKVGDSRAKVAILDKVVEQQEESLQIKDQSDQLESHLSETVASLVVKKVSKPRRATTA